MTRNERPPITDEQRGGVMNEIQRLIAQPPARRQHADNAFPESAAINSPEARRALDQMRTKLAADRGLTLEQWIAMENDVSHPRQVLSVTLTPKMLARRRMMAAGVPEKFIVDVADKAPLDVEPMKHVRSFLESRDAFRVLSGGKGVKKTGSASWALGQLDGGVFVHSRDLTRLRIEERAQWERLCTAPVIVLDDLGVEQGDGKGAFVASVSELVDRVYGRMSRLILTCNLTPQTFRAYYGEREYDRLREMGQWSSIAGTSTRTYQGEMQLPRERQVGEDG